MDKKTEELIALIYEYLYLSHRRLYELEDMYLYTLAGYEIELMYEVRELMRLENQIDEETDDELDGYLDEFQEQISGEEPILPYPYDLEVETKIRDIAAKVHPYFSGLEGFFESVMAAYENYDIMKINEYWDMVMNDPLSEEPDYNSLDLDSLIREVTDMTSVLKSEFPFTHEEILTNEEKLSDEVEKILDDIAIVKKKIDFYKIDEKKIEKRYLN